MEILCEQGCRESGAKFAVPRFAREARGTEREQRSNGADARGPSVPRVNLVCKAADISINQGEYRVYVYTSYIHIHAHLRSTYSVISLHSPRARKIIFFRHQSFDHAFIELASGN